MKLWDAALKECKVFHIPQGPISSMTFNASGQILAAADGSYQINLIKLKPQMEVSARLLGHRDIVNTCVFSSEENKKMVSVSMDRSMKIWDVSNQRELKSSSFASTSLSLAISANDANFVTGHKNGEVKIWSLGEMKEVQTIQRVHNAQMTCVKFTPDCSKIVTASCDNTIKVIDMRQSKVLHTIEDDNLFLP